MIIESVMFAVAQHAITGYSLQVWLVSVVTSALLLIKGAQLLKDLWRGSDKNNNGARTYQTIHEAEFRGKTSQLINNQLEILKKITENLDNNRHMIGEMMNAQASIAQMLDDHTKILEEHAKLLEEHNERESTIWSSILKTLENFQRNTRDSWNACHDKLVKIERSLT